MFSLASIGKQDQLQVSHTRNVELKFPGVAQTWGMPFFTSNPGWLSQRTFTADVFFCPSNGHEGTITNVFGQLLSQVSPAEYIALDIGSNLGFYSLLSSALGFEVFAVDIQPMCLFALHSLAVMAGTAISDRIHSFNIGLSDEPGAGSNSYSKCDYENFIVEAGAADQAAKQQDPRPQGEETTFDIISFDSLVSRNPIVLSKPVQVMKIDTEGVEARILMGMRQALGSGKIKHMIIEVTPAHWDRFGLSMTDERSIQIFQDVVTTYGYTAYVMYLQKERWPPVSMADIAVPVKQSPVISSQRDTGCEGCPFFLIKDMRRFLKDYCVTHLAKIKKAGSCGNLLFVKK